MRLVFFKRFYYCSKSFEDIYNSWKMRLVAGEPNATYVTINLGEIYIADNIKEKSFGLDGRLDELLPALREACEA